MASGTGPEHMNGRVGVQKKPSAVTGSVSQEAPWLRRRENQSWHSAWELGNVEIILGD